MRGQMEKEKQDEEGVEIGVGGTFAPDRSRPVTAFRPPK